MNPIRTLGSSGRISGILALGVFLLHPFVSSSQTFERIEIPSSPNPVGSGARALGTGGAFIAVADDATAASWNPAGLIQLERPEVSAVGAYFGRNQDNTFSLSPEASETDTVSKGRVNYLSLVYPFAAFGRNMVAAITYQNLFDMSEDWDFTYAQTVTDLSVRQNLRSRQDGTLSAWGVSYAIQLGPTFSCGATLNLWKDGMYESGWTRDIVAGGQGTLAGYGFTVESIQHERTDFDGLNANLGFLWNVSGTVTLGGILKTPFTADITYAYTLQRSLDFPDAPSMSYSKSVQHGFREDLDMPMSYGLGLAYRHSDRLSFSGDIYRTHWEDFKLTDSEGVEKTPITGQNAAESDIGTTTQVRAGVEYLVITENYIVPIRGGLFYDPAPAKHSPDDYYGVSLGSGLSMNRFSFDVAYQYRFGNNVGGSILEDLGFSQDLREHTVYTSLIVYF